MSKGMGNSRKGFVLLAISLTLMIPDPMMAAGPIVGKASLGSSSNSATIQQVGYTSQKTSKSKSRSSNPFSKLSSRLKKVFRRGEKKTNEPKKLPMIAGMSPTKSPAQPSGQKTAQQSLRRVQVKTATKQPQKVTVPSKATSKNVDVPAKLEDLYSKTGVELPEDFRPIAAPAPTPAAKTTKDAESAYTMKRTTTRTHASAVTREPIVVKQSPVGSKSKPTPATQKDSTVAPRKLEIAESKPAVMDPVQTDEAESKSIDSDEVDPAFAAALKSEVNVVKEKVSVTTTETTTTVETKIEEHVAEVQAEAAKFPNDVTDEFASVEDAAKKKNEVTISAVSVNQAYLTPTPADPNEMESLKPAYTEMIVDKTDSDEFEMPVTQVSNSTAPKQPKNLTPNQRKMQRIAERTGQIGFKGFCPVVLRDQRELVDAIADYQWSYNGRTYDFSSEAALEKFKESPHVYAPAFRGSDIVLIREHQLDQQGQLDHATWYQGRLFLFSNAENMKKFRSNPKSFVTKK